LAAGDTRDDCSFDHFVNRRDAPRISQGANETENDQQRTVLFRADMTTSLVTLRAITSRGICDSAATSRGCP
jgi:hypothetical protein